MTRYDEGPYGIREGSDEQQWRECWPHGLHPAAEFWVGAAQLLHDTAVAQVQAVEAAISRSAHDGTPIDPELQGAWTTIEARRSAAMDVLGRVKDVAEYGSEHGAATARAAEQDHRDQVRAVYQHLYDPAYYAHIEGDGGREDAYCDTVYARAEALVAQGYTAQRLADLDAEAAQNLNAAGHGPVSTQRFMPPEWVPTGADADFRLEASSIDSAPGMTAAQLRGDETRAAQQWATADVADNPRADDVEFWETQRAEQAVIRAYWAAQPPVETEQFEATVRAEWLKDPELAAVWDFTDYRQFRLRNVALADRWAAADVADDPAADHVEYWERVADEAAAPTTADVDDAGAVEPGRDARTSAERVTDSWTAGRMAEYARRADPVVWGSVAPGVLDELDQARARLEAGDIEPEREHELAEYIEHLEETAEQAADDELAGGASVPAELARGGDPVLAAETEAWLTAQAVATERWLREERDQLCANEDYLQEWSVADPVEDRPVPAEFVTGEDPTPEQESYPAPWDASRSGPAVPDSAESPGKAQAADAVAAAHQTVVAELQQATEEQQGSRQASAPAAADNQLDMTSTDCDGAGVE